MVLLNTALLWLGIDHFVYVVQVGTDTQQHCEVRRIKLIAGIAYFTMCMFVLLENNNTNTLAGGV